MPILFLMLLLTGVISLSLLASGIYMSWLLYTGQLEGTYYIFLAGTLLLTTLFGKYFVLFFFPSSKTQQKYSHHLQKGTFISGEEKVKLHVNFFHNNHKRTLLLTHGWGLNSSEWHPLMTRLKKIGNIVTWDLPGLGKSTKPKSGNYNISTMAKNLKKVIDHVDDKEVILVGHSIGGMIMLTFCRMFPEYIGTKVTKIVFGNTTHTKPIHTTVLSTVMEVIEKPIIKPLCYITIWFSPLIRVINVINYQSGILHMGTAFLGFAGNQTREELEFATKFSIKAQPEVLARGILAMLQFEETKVLSKIAIPTQIIYSDQDIVTIPKASYLMKSSISNAQLVKLQAGHMGVIEKSEEFIKKLSQFIQLKPLIKITP